MKRYIHSFLIASFVVVFFLLTSCQQGRQELSISKEQRTSAKPVTLTISAAASLKDAMGEISTLYKKEAPNVTLNMNFGSSGALQQQIEQGANVDLFFSAATKQMDALKKKGLILENTDINLLGNSVVIIVNNNTALNISDFKTLAEDTIKKIALGEPKTVPVGQYTEEIFTSLGINDKIKAKAVYGSDVKQVLSWVEAGNADAGIVYSTDAKVSKKVKVAALAGKNLYKTPIVYPAAVIKASKNAEDTKAFLKFLSSDKAKDVFIKYGFDFLLK